MKLNPFATLIPAKPRLSAQIPLKQGLKHRNIDASVDLFEILSAQIPLKQGLKRIRFVRINSKSASFSTNSIKTRIETSLISVKIPFSKTLSAQIPLKQGLKRVY